MKLNYELLKRILMLAVLALSVSGLKAQSEVDVLPNQNVSGTLLICRHGDSGVYVEYAETKYGNFFYRTTIGGDTTKKAAFTEDIKVKDITSDGRYVYFCGENTLGKGIIGRFSVSGLFGGISGYEYADVNCVIDPGLENCITTVNKIAWYIYNNKRYVAFVAEMNMKGWEDSSLTTVGCATCESGAWDVWYWYNKDKMDGFEDVAVTENHVVTVGRRTDNQGYNAWMWKKRDDFLNHFESGRKVSAVVTQEPQICALTHDTIAVATCNGNRVCCEKMDVSTGDFQYNPMFSNTFDATSLHEMVYNTNRNDLVMHISIDTIAVMGSTRFGTRKKGGCTIGAIHHVTDAVNGASVAVAKNDNDVYLCQNDPVSTTCHNWISFRSYIRIHQVEDYLQSQSPMHGPVDNHDFMPIVVNVVQSIYCSE